MYPLEARYLYNSKNLHNNFNPLRPITAYTSYGNKYITVHKNIITLASLRPTHNLKLLPFYLLFSE